MVTPMTASSEHAVRGTALTEGHDVIVHRGAEGIAAQEYGLVHVEQGIRMREVAHPERADPLPAHPAGAHIHGQASDVVERDGLPGRGDQLAGEARVDQGHVAMSALLGAECKRPRPGGSASRGRQHHRKGD